MRNVRIFFIAVFMAAAALLFSGCASNQSAALPQGSAPTAGTVAENAGKDLVSYSLEEVAAHATVSDCWMSIGGKVYDLSRYNVHPGGESMLERGCGKDATELYANKGGTGSEHSRRANIQLDTYQIGVLKQ